MTDKKAKTRTAINELIAERWSPRAFDPERAIDEDKIIALMEAARWSPSCFNEQPWRYIFCYKRSNEDAWQKALSCLTEKNQLWAKNAPLLILACAYNLFGHNSKQNRWAMYDTGAASENICLQATSMGMYAHQMGGFDIQLAMQQFSIPENVMPMAMIAAGYMGDLSKLDRVFVDSETGGRERKPLDQLFFNGSWNELYSDE